jgi:hypothetical protein
MVITNNTAYNINFLKRYNCKHSKDIIDLIEVGDYVNGSRVVGFAYNEESFNKGIDKKEHVVVEERWELTKYSNEDIKTIVTKELYKSVEYVL